MTPKRTCEGIPLEKRARGRYLVPLVLAYFLWVGIVPSALAAIPPTPTLSSPTNGSKVNGTSIAFKWNAAAGANNYYFQVAHNSAFTQVVYGAWIGNYIGITLTGLLDNGQVYHWRVAAGNALGSSLFSGAWTVTNGPSAVPAIPTLSSPTNGSKVNGTSIAFKWNAAARANNYYLQVAYDPAFTQVVYGAWIGNYIGITITGLPDNGQVYYWRVAAGNALGKVDPVV